MTLWLRSLARSGRFLAPVAAYAFVVLGVYAYGGNPVLDSFAATALLLTPAAAWLGLALLDTGELALLELAGVRRGAARVGAERAAAGLLLVAGLAALAVGAPAAADASGLSPGLLDDAVTGGKLARGLTAHLACGAVGLGLAACAARGAGPFRRAALAAAAVLAAQLALVALGAPPLALIDALHDGRPLAGPLLAAAALAAGLLAASVALGARRR